MSFKSVNEAFSYIESFTNLEKKTNLYEREYRLDRMKQLLELFDNPQNNFKVIHVAGSKGKGSTSAFISSILSEMGYKTGLYSSPHVISYKERITLSGMQFPDEIYIEEISRIKNIIDTLPRDFLVQDSKPTTFELLTILAFNIFSLTKCSWVVLETGLGGRLDATNVVNPELSVITPIELEHTAILGNTLDKIAIEKAGIIKKTKPVISSMQNDIVKKVLSDKANEMDSDILFSDDIVNIIKSVTNKKGNIIKIAIDNSIIKTRLKLAGTFQSDNAGLAALCILKLFPDAKTKVIAKGLSKAIISGRMEIIKYRKRYIVLDGAHTPFSIGKILINFQNIFKNRNILIFASVLDKNYLEMANILGSNFSNIYISTPGYFKESDPNSVYKAFKKINDNTELLNKPEDAFNKALKSCKRNSAILVTGSFYLVSEIKRLLS